MTRLPIRVRIAVAFAVAMALVIAGTGTYVYTHLGSDLNRSLDQDLRLRAQDLTAVLARGEATLKTESGGRLVERGESFAQLVDAHGRVLDGTHSIGGRSLLDRGDLERALLAPALVNRRAVPGLDEPARLLATPVRRGAQRLVLVVGATRENRAETLRSVRSQLLIAGPVALVLATWLGYVLAGTGLRAVDDMRRRAAEISADNPGERLPLPPARDELQRLGATLNEMLARLEAALAREREFVADASHELRSPLALLRAELDFALHHTGSEEEMRAALREASAETDRLVQLSGDLLLIAGADRNGVPLRRETVQVPELLESVRNRFTWRADEENRKLVVEASADLAVEGDRLRLEQALGNMVENALRHGSGTVELSPRRREGCVELHVSDQGAGIPTAFAARAFERFSRGDHAHGPGGAGLGLAIVDAVARAHGGTAHIAHRSGSGADVWLSLPA